MFPLVPFECQLIKLPKVISPEEKELAGHISNIIDQLRQTIKTQRTALLDQGLELALESLVVEGEHWRAMAFENKKWSDELKRMWSGIN